MNDIYKRLKQISDLKGFNSINDFAKNGLKYSSSEKLNRLKNENAKPGWEILQDISNMFEDVNLHWFVTGKGEITYEPGKLTEPASFYGSDSELINTKDKLIEVLEIDIKELRRDKEFLKDLIKSKLINQ